MAKKDQVAKTGDTSITKEGVPAGFEHFDESDLIIPRLGIVQPSSRNGTPGTFRSNLTSEEWKEMRITPFTYRKGMVYWKDGEELGDPICRSRDALTPDSKVDKPQNPTCHTRTDGRLLPTCPRATWPEGDGKPDCAMTFDFLAMGEGDKPFMISLRGMSVRSAKALISHVWHMRQNFYDVSCRMYLTKTENRKGVFYVVGFGDFTSHESGKYESAYKAICAPRGEKGETPF